MYFRIKKTQYAHYLQLVESKRVDGKPRQTVLMTLGKLDETGATLNVLDSLLISGARLSEKLAVLAEHDRADVPVCDRLVRGPDLVFGKLWKETGIQSVLKHLLKGRKFGFDVERAIYITVLHRIMVSGSDLSCDVWRQNQDIPGQKGLSLHQFYRAMEWLGESLDEWNDSDPFDRRYRTQQIEEILFQKHRDLFTELGMVFFDTTSLFFEGQGGRELGQFGYSKDRKSDRHQMIVGIVIDDQGHPICMQMWPGSTSDVTTLGPLADRLKHRFGVNRMCVVCDRGMISGANLRELEQAGIHYIIGTRMRNDTVVKDEILRSRGRYSIVRDHRLSPKDLAPLKVKSIQHDEGRYIICLNEEEAVAESLKRDALIQSLRKKLKQGNKHLVGNSGYRRYLKQTGPVFSIDKDKIRDDARFDGKYVLKTTLTLPAEEIALKYKELYRIERVIRQVKHTLKTRPIFHQTDSNIRGHVFCSFLALKLLKELEQRLYTNGSALSHDRLCHELNEVYTSAVTVGSKRYAIRSSIGPLASEAIRAVGANFDQKICQITQEDSDL